MQRKGISIIAIPLACALIVSALATEELMLVPMPREVSPLGWETPLAADWVICVPDKNPDDQYAAEVLAKEAEDCFGWPWKIVEKAPEEHYVLLKDVTRKDTGMILHDGSVLGHDVPELFLEQGYLLTTERDRIIIEAPTAVGRFYGVQTLRQLLRTADAHAIPQLKIKDYPALQWRGISDDISRGQVSTLQDFKEIIRQLVFYKKNIYQPYIEDMFTFDTDPNIGKDRGAITKSEMAQMVAEAKRNHIVLTPVFECLGHQDRLLSLPENRKYAEIQDPDRSPWSFSPVNPDALKFVEELITELAEATPSPFFHIGGDEAFDVGTGTSEKRVKKIGIGRVHAEYFTRLHDFLKEQHNRQIMLYSDMLLHHPEALQYLPKDTILVDWHYGLEDKFPSIKTLKDAGFKNIIASPGIWSWASFYPNFKRAFTNVANFTTVAKQEQLMGCITSSWGDNGAENLRENNWIAYAFSAAAEWEAETPDPDKFLKRYVAVRYGVDSPDLAKAEKTLGWLEYFDVANPGQLLHRSPTIRPYEDALLEKMASLETDMKTVRQIVATWRDKVRFDRSHLDSIDHAAHRYYYMAERYRTLDGIARTLADKKSGELPLTQQSEIIGELNSIRSEWIDLTAEYEHLWLRRNKFPKLDFNLERMQKQAAELSDLIVLAEAGNLAVYEEPQPVWFWYPEKEPTLEAEKGNKYFVRVIDLKQRPVSARIKCWADDKATVFLNGEKVLEATYGEPAVVRRVSRLLKTGKNYLAIEGYNMAGAAGILVNLSIRLADRTTLQITGDEEWATSNRATWHWKTRDPKGRKWIKVKLLGKGLMKPWDSIDW
jgi:hexosaminidase